MHVFKISHNYIANSCKFVASLLVRNFKRLVIYGFCNIMLYLTVVSHGQTLCGWLTPGFLELLLSANVCMFACVFACVCACVRPRGYE